MDNKFIERILNRPKRKGLADTIDKIVKNCPTCKKRKSPTRKV